MAGVRGCTHPKSRAISISVDIHQYRFAIRKTAAARLPLLFHAWCALDRCVAHHSLSACAIRAITSRSKRSSNAGLHTAHRRRRSSSESIPPFPTSTGDPTSLRMVDVNFLELDAYQWIHVNKPGTYTIHRHLHRASRRCDSFLLTSISFLSNAISPVDTLAITDLPPAAQQPSRKRPLIARARPLLRAARFSLPCKRLRLDRGPAKLSVSSSISAIHRRRRSG